MSGGLINLPTPASSWFLPNRGGNGEASVINMSGGTINFVNLGTGFNANWSSSQSTTFTISGNAQFLSPGINLNLNRNNVSSNACVLNLDGGDFQANGFTNETNAVVNFNGGALTAGNTSNTTYLTALAAAYVYSVGGTLGNNGQSITIGQALLASTGSGLQTGTTAVSYSSGFTAPPRVVFVGTGAGATGYATISQTTGAITGFVVTNPGVGYTAAPTVDLIIANGGTTDISSTWTPSLTANASGGMVFQGSGSTTLTGLSTYTGGTTVTAGTLALGAASSGIGTLRGPLNIASGATVNLTVGDAVGYNSGAALTTVSLNGGRINNATGSNESYITNYVLTGGIMSSTGRGSYNFTTGYGITTNASAATSLISSGIIIRDANNLTFNVAAGTTPSGVDLLDTGVISNNSASTVSSITKTGAGEMVAGSVSDTYTGSTTVSNGSLLLSSGSLYGAGTVSVSGGATFGGNGSAGSVSIASGGTLQGGYGGAGILRLPSAAYSGRRQHVLWRGRAQQYGHARHRRDRKAHDRQPSPGPGRQPCQRDDRRRLRTAELRLHRGRGHRRLSIWARCPTVRPGRSRSPRAWSI